MSEIETGALGRGRVEPRELEQEMRSSFLDYAMSVIVSRALPDVRDGLKPVHRRVLYSMWAGGNRPGRPYVKCARIVGDVMGNYHPHGDSAIYDALVRLAQPFSLRYPLVDGQGNFGSVDDDPPAAMRYTEARLARLATELLEELDSDTVDFGPNYDESKREPLVLPARFPNLLVNGSSGIAVGMATNIPPHNLREVTDAIIAMIDEPDISVEKLMTHVKGPDFPTGGIIVGRAGIRDAYRSGRGRVVMRARAHIEELRGGKSAIIVSELPYTVRKGGDNGVIKKIADLVNDKVLTEISDLADHSDRTGMRIQIELKRDAIPQVALNKLFKHTGLQSTFGYNAVALVEGEFNDLQERIGELRALLSDETRIDGVIRDELLELREIHARDDDRRTEIVAAEEELELEDLIAEEDMVIAITHSGYVKRLPVTAYREQRRGGIGVMGMDLKEDDYIEHLFVASTHDYILFFTSVGKVYRLKVHELPLGSRQSKGRAIVNLLPFRQEEQVRTVVQTRDFKEAEYLVFATKNGVVKKTKLEAYNTPLKSDGIIAIKMREGDELVGVRHSTGKDDILMVSRKGQAIRFSEQEARPMGRDASGVQGMRLRSDDEVISINIAHNDADLLVVTENGYGKRTRIDEYPRKGRGGMGVKTVQLTEAKGKLAGARVVREGYQVMLISNGGTVIRMPVEEVKRLGRSTQGVIVMRLREGEQVSTLAPVVEPEEPDAEQQQQP